MAKDLKIGLLNELYGALLTARQYDAVKAYYDFDLSLGEIAENLGVTRQAVRDAIAKGEAALLAYEDKLGFLQKSQAVKTALRDAEMQIGVDNDRARDGIRRAADSL